MSIQRQFFKYVTQNIFGMLGVSCYIIADTFFIAQEGGADGITALNLVLPIYSIIFAIGAMIGVGSATRFAILRGQGNETAEYYFSNAVISVCMIGSIGILAGMFIPHKILAWMGADAGIIALGTGYTRIFLLFTPFFMLNQVVSAFVRNDNDPFLAMIATVAGSISNIIFDYIFMFQLELGFAGAALATAASPVISILICLIHFTGKKNSIHFYRKKASLKKLLQSCQLGFSAFVGELSSGITTATYNFLILGLVGNVGVAAYGVIANYAIVATAIFNGIAQGMQPLVSEYYGKGEKGAVRKLLKLGSILALGLAFFLIILVFGFTEPMVALFNSEGDALLTVYANNGIRFYVLGYLFAGINIVGAGFLSATAQPRGAFVISILRGCVLIFVLSVLFAKIFGINGIWWSFFATELGTMLVLGVSFLKRK